MNKTKTLLAAAFLACGLLTLTLATGCATTGGGGPPISPQSVGTVAEVAAYTGTQVYLRDHPTERPKFEAALAALAVLKAGTNATPAQVQEALDKLPIKQLQGDKGTIIISTAVILYDSLARQYVNVEATPEWLREFMNGAYRGLARALGNNSP